MLWVSQTKSGLGWDEEKVDVKISSVNLMLFETMEITVVLWQSWDWLLCVDNVSSTCILDMFTDVGDLEDGQLLGWSWGWI